MHASQLSWMFSVTPNKAFALPRMLWFFAARAACSLLVLAAPVVALVIVPNEALPASGIETGIFLYQNIGHKQNHWLIW